MFCNKCGAQLPDDAQFCNACGNNLQAAPAQSIDFVAILKKNMTKIVAVIALFALVIGCMNLFSALNPGAFPEEGDASFNSSLAAMVETFEDESFAAVYIGNILFGLACLVAAVVGISYYLKKVAKDGTYDKLFGKINMRPGLLMGVLGTVGALLQVVMYLLKEEFYGVKLGVHWMTWVSLGIFVLLAAADILTAKKK